MNDTTKPDVWEPHRPRPIDSCHVPRFAIAPDAALEGWLTAWARAYVVARSWPTLAASPPTLTESARAQIEEAINRDLEGAGRSERVDIAAELEEQGVDLALRWKLRGASADAAPSPEEMAASEVLPRGGHLECFAGGIRVERARAVAREQEAVGRVAEKARAMIQKELDDVARTSGELAAEVERLRAEQERVRHFLGSALRLTAYRPDKTEHDVCVLIGHALRAAGCKPGPVPPIFSCPPPPKAPR